MFKLIQISDTHLTAGDATSVPGWQAALRHIAAAKPDLVIHTGDIVRDSPLNRDDHAFARSELERLPAEWLAIPGNHDVGEGPPRDIAVTPELLTSFVETYGADHWERKIPGWRLMGLNTMLFDTGFPAEAEQAAWFEAKVTESAEEPIALFIHKPPFVICPDEDQLGTATIPGKARAWLWPLVERFGIRLVACGHRHEYRAIQYGGTMIVWAPTTSLLLDERTPPFGENRCRPGLIEYHFTDNAMFHSVIDLGALQQAAA